MYIISHQLYLEIGEKLMEAIGRKGFYSGEVAVWHNDVECRLSCTLFAERAKEAEEGNRLPRIVRLTPVWWECHTFRSGEEILNGFSFREFTSAVL